MQRRSQVTQDAFLDAAEHLFAERGIEATSVADVATQARRSIGSLYHQFRNKDALVRAVVERIGNDLEAVIEGSLEPEQWKRHSIDGIVRSYAESAVALSGARPGYKRITLEASLVDEALRERFRELRGRLDRGMTSLLLARSQQIGHKTPEVAVRFVVDQLSGMISARLDSHRTSTELSELSHDAWVEQLVESVCNYLRVSKDE